LELVLPESSLCGIPFGLKNYTLLKFITAEDISRQSFLGNDSTCHGDHLKQTSEDFVTRNNDISTWLSFAVVQVYGTQSLKKNTSYKIINTIIFIFAESHSLKQNMAETR